MTGLNPLDWYGTEFLLLYGALLGVALLAGSAIAASLRLKGDSATISNPDELAVLSGNGDRLTEAVVSRLMARGALTIERKKDFISAPGAAARDELEATLLAMNNPVRWTAMRKALRGKRDEIRDNLVGRGLLLDRGDRLMLGLAAAMPLALLLALGLSKYMLGVARDRPVGILTVLMIITAGLFLWRWLATSELTKAGKAAYRDARNREARLRIAPRGEETGMAVALFGTAVIATSPIGDLHRLRAASGGSGDGAGGDGDGSGGCGGGGCGGCGG